MDVIEKSNCNRGFTLVELSIVLVIIGLLISGVLVAQSLVDSAKIKAQIKQIEQFDIAISQFQQRFRMIPGDCPDTMCSYKTYSGDGNGILNDQVAGREQGPPIRFIWEPYYFFIDLNKMGIIKDEYDLENNSYHIGEGNQFPLADIGRGGVFMTGNSAGELYYSFMYTGFPYDGGFNSNFNFDDSLAEGNFSPAEALAIERKIDDGDPATGIIAATDDGYVVAGHDGYPFSQEADNASSCVFGGQYNVALDATNLCRIVIKAISDLD